MRLWTANCASPWYFSSAWELHLVSITISSYLRTRECLDRTNSWSKRLPRDFMLLRQIPHPAPPAPRRALYMPYAHIPRAYNTNSRWGSVSFWNDTSRVSSFKSPSTNCKNQANPYTCIHFQMQTDPFNSRQLCLCCSSSFSLKSICNFPHKFSYSLVWKLLTNYDTNIVTILFNIKLPASVTVQKLKETTNLFMYIYFKSDKR